ncbi:hypothetical protein [Cytobacillus sp.]|uniref:hypothetical protein n=1 Tax=Cytobacillus sp. TaxID=2675269 RepID=UPI0028BD9333|nr:hypothetical protein [Cytobacillus sp.]
MSDKSYHYKKELKERVLNSLQSFDPRYQMPEREIQDCPNCAEKENFYYTPSYKYGRCVDCSYEIGFEYYSTVMDSRIKTYLDLEKRIKESLETF